jgi:hypothetical protein
MNVGVNPSGRIYVRYIVIAADLRATNCDEVEDLKLAVELHHFI